MTPTGSLEVSEREATLLLAALYAAAYRGNMDSAHLAELRPLRERLKRLRAELRIR